MLAAVQARIAALQHDYPGVGVEDRGAEIHVDDPGRVPRRPRGALRAGDHATSELHARPEGAARVGAAEHAGEVLRDDDGHGNEPPEPLMSRPVSRRSRRSRAGKDGRAVR